MTADDNGWDNGGWLLAAGLALVLMALLAGMLFGKPIIGKGGVGCHTGLVHIAAQALTQGKGATAGMKRMIQGRPEAAARTKC